MINVYDEIATKIINQMESGIIPWKKPWVTLGGAVSHNTGKPYSFLNQILLGKPGEYVTFKQAQAAGGHVKKGAKSRMVVFWKPFATNKTEDGDIKVERHYVLKYYNVFHLDDCEGISPKWTKPELHDNQPIDAAEKTLRDYTTRCGISLDISTRDEAFYSPARDEICLPALEQFDSAEAFYDTAFHEAAHSTGHASRLNRFTDGSSAKFGSSEYSKEELIAELGGAAIMHTLGLETPETFTNNAAYIQGWLTALKADKRLLVSAASEAEKAVKMILGISDDKVEEEDSNGEVD